MVIPVPFPCFGAYIKNDNDRPKLMKALIATAAVAVIITQQPPMMPRGYSSVSSLLSERSKNQSIDHENSKLSVQFNDSSDIQESMEFFVVTQENVISEIFQVYVVNPKINHPQNHQIWVV